MVYGMVDGANKFAVNPCQNGVRGGLRFRQSKAREIRLMGFFLFYFPFLLSVTPSELRLA
jgi:hypothetical protein